jgi:hypothetical protein
VLFDRGQRFTYTRAKTDRDLTERAEHVFLAVGLRLLIGEHVAGAAVPGAQSDDVLTAKACDRSLDHRSARGPHAHALRDRGRQARVGRLVHQQKRSPHAVVGDQVEERRLPELYRESLPQRLVEHRIAGRVVELGEHERVPVGQRRGAADGDDPPRPRP